MGDIFKGLCENVKGEMDGNKKNLEEMIEKEAKERRIGVEEATEKANM